MKRVLWVFLLAAAAILGDRWLEGRRALAAYEKFADAWTRGDRVEAARHGEADAVRHALERRALRGMPSGSIMEAFRGTRYEIESKVRSPESLRLEAKQTIFFDPPGATTAIGGAMIKHIHHSATLRKTGDGWKVAAFEPTYLDMGEARRR